MNVNEDIKKIEAEEESKLQKARNRQILVWSILAAAAIFWLIFHFGFAFLTNVLIVLLGIGLIIISHEFGHFITAKAVDMNVTAFSIGFPPTFIGIKKTQKGCRVRILPSLFKKSASADDETNDSHFTYYVGKAGKDNDTEFRLGLIPFGGYVKIVGQEDVGSIQHSDDPRSYVNKSIWKRFAVVVMGVIFNAILAVAMFMLIFGVGKKLPPPVVGGIEPGSPAAKAGLVEGDEIIEIAGSRSYLDFSDIAMAAALSGKNQKMAMEVRHKDGSIGQYEIAAEKDGDIRQFGIMQPATLTVTDKLPREDADELFKQTALKPGDKITAVNGIEVKSYWQLYQIINSTFAPKITLLAERTRDINGVKQTKLIEGTAHLAVSTSAKQTASKKSPPKKDLGNYYTLVPRLKVIGITGNAGLLQYENWFKNGDVIVRIADVNDPNYGQFVDAINAYEDKDMPVEVLRAGTDGAEKIVQVDVIPRYNRSLYKVALGVIFEPDLSRPVVAETVSIKDGPKGLEIPKGATITAVNGQKVSSFYDILGIAYQNAGKNLQFDWTKGTETGSVILSEQDWKTIKPARSFIADVPFEPVVKLYKAENIIQAVQMGYHKTWSFIIMSYLSVRRVAEGLVGSNELMGPVGIATISYRIVSSYSIQDFLYLLALLSACIAALNIMPMLPFDGGLALFLIIEKIKGSPVSEKIQNAFVTTGWVLVGGLFLYVTFNDILRLF